MDRTWLVHVLIWLCFVNHITAVSVEQQSLLGCGAVTRPSRIFPYSPGNYDFNSNTPGSCMQACSASGYAYASVSAGNLCFCGSASANTTLLNTTTTSCQVDVCTGDSNYYCGGINYELVYTSAGFIDSASIALIGGTSAMNLIVNTNYQFNVGYQGAVNSINYFIDFGDGTQTGWFGGNLSTTTTVSHIFTTTGQFSVSVQAQSVIGMQPVLSAMVVQVSDQISALDVSMTCPNVTTTQITVSCIFTCARGTDLTANFTYNASNSVYSIANIPDAQYSIFGSPYVTNNPTLDTSINLLTATDIAILPQSTVTVAGRIGSIQFYSSSAGTINIYLLRLICSSPMTYCYNSNTCGNCGNPYSLQCPSSIYSTISRSCVNASLTQRYQQATYSGAQFEIVAQWTIVTSGPGYQQIVANTIPNMMNHTALVGDILAFKGLYIGKEISTDTTQDYLCTNPTITGNTFTCAVGSLSSNNTRYHYLLQTTIIQSVQIAPDNIYYNVGDYDVEGTITQANVASYSASATLLVLNAIQWIEIVGPSTGNVNVMVSFIANVYPVNVTVTTYIWSINGNNTFNSTSDTMNVSFTTTGTYTIGCQVQNLISNKSNTTTIVVQDIITNFSLHAGNVTNVSTSEPMQIARFQLRMATGSNYVCRVNFDTSQSATSTYFYTYGYVPGSYLTYEYLQPGQYNVYATCENSVSNVSYSFIHYVQYPIVGLELQEQGVTQNTNFSLNFTIAQGTSPQFLILVNGTQVNYTYYPQYNLAQTSLFNGQAASSNFTIEVYSWNYISTDNLSTVFSIIALVVNPQIRASTINTNFPGPILFEYTMDSGSNIDILFSFGDTLADTPVVCQYIGNYPLGVWSSCSGTNHTFQIPGTRTIIATFTNAISTVYKYLTVTLTTSVNPIEVTTGLQLLSSQCAAAFIDDRAIASFIIQAKNSTAKPASNAQVIIIPDAINNPTVTQGPFDLTFDYFASPAATSSGLNVIYTSTGNYTAIFEVSNSMDSTNISCNVQVVPVLQQVYYSIIPLNWPLNNPTPLQASVYIGDLNPGTVILVWNFGDGTNISSVRTATQYNQADTKTHSYASVGTYILTIMAQGPLNTVTNTFTINVQHPVLSFNVTFPGITGPSSQLSYGGSSTTVTITVTDTSSPPATNALLLIDFNDTSPLTTNSVINVSLPYTGSYTYISPGVFTVNFTVYNYVSSITQIIDIAINAPFNNYNFTVCYLLPTLTNPLSDTCNLALNSGFYYIPKQSQLVIYVTWSNPSGVPNGFNVSFIDASNTNVFTQMLTVSQAINISNLVGVTSGSPLFRLVVDLESNTLLPDGSYTVRVATYNPSYTSTSSLNIYILSAIAGLTVTDNGIVVPINTLKTFYAIYQNFSSLSCLYIQYSDNIIECYGVSTTCLSLPSDLSSSLSACSLPINAFTYQNSSVTFTHSFNKSSGWLFAYGWDQVTTISAQAFLAFPLSTVGCSVPIINFDIYNPIMRWSRQVKRSEAFSVSAQTIINCSNSLNNTKQWNILQCDTTTQQCSSTAYLRQLVSQLSSSMTSEIYIQSQQLPLGTYLFNYTVTMNSYTAFSAFGYTYVTVIASDIQVNLLANGTSIITSGVTQSILFQPGVYSIDPDSNYFNPNNWTFAYYCRIYGVDSYPSYDGAELTIDSTIVDPANPSCLNPPGNTSLFKYGPNNNQSILYIQPNALESDRSYEFKAIITNIYDTTLQYTGYALVEIQDTESVLISAECVIQMCLPDAEYQRINPTTQALVTSYCVQSCDNATDIVIEWNVYRGFQPGYPNDDVQWILYPNIDAYNNILFYGRDTSNLTVTSQLFLNNPTIQYWQFEAVYTVTSINGIATGGGAIRFIINSPPANGTCTIDQTNGTSMTLFTFTCLNWVDSDGIQGYSFYAYTTANATKTPVGYTTLTYLQVYLPIGDSNANYALQLSADITDTYGAVTSVDISTVTVTPDNAILSAFIQLSQQASTQGRGTNALETILYGGDQNSVCQLVGSLSQTLNSMDSATLQAAISANIPAQDLCVSGLLSSFSNATNASANSTLAMAAYVSALNQQAIVRDYAVQFVSNLSITNINSIILQASTLSSLTDATEELTRQTVASAAEKCSDLVNALNQMSNTVSYEDAQLATDYIAQLASNLLVASNTPLLGRGTVIGLDYDRATMLPSDYETDIEDPWSNIKALADGDDYSWQTIQNNRNWLYQQQTSNQLATQVQAILSTIVNVLSLHMNVGQTNIISTNSISMLTEKMVMNNLTSLTISQSGAEIILPPLSYCSILLANETCSNSTPITLSSIVLPLATAGYNGQNGGAYVNMSRSISLTLSFPNGTTIPVNNLPSPIQIIIPHDPSLILPPMTFENVTDQTPITGPNNNPQFSLYYTNVTSPGQGLTLSVTFEFKSEDPTVAILLIYRYDAIPILNTSMNQIDGYQILCPAAQIYTSSDGYLYSYFLDNTQTVNHQYVMFGIRQLSPTEVSNYCSNNSNSTLPITNANVNFTANYYVRAYTSACYYLDQNSYWQTSNLVVGPQTNEDQTECLTNHLTTFAGGWIVLPAPINWNYVFANLSFVQNLTIYITMIIILILYIIIMIYARYKDKKDIEKLGVTPLPDNLVYDKYYYQIIVFTGLRKDAGTDSKVHFVISGDDEETGVRTFEDPHRKILQRGAINSFIMAVPKSLGRLNYMRVWHDNSGAGKKASWFLKYIIVRDLQTMEKNHFICQQWFAVEKDDGSVDRLIPVAGEEQKREFAYLLSKKTYHSMSDGHLWFSVFSRPPSTRFTRVQRCTCCFVLLLMSLLMNIMYYDQTVEAETNATGGITLGPFFLTPEQIGIGVIVELICFIPSTLLVEMFRRLRLRRRPQSPVREALQKIQNEHQKKIQQAALNDIHPHLTNYTVNPDPILSRHDLEQMRNTLMTPLPNKQPPPYIKINDELKFKNKNSKKLFPWWFIFIAYGISLVIVLVSAIFIIARGIQFGNLKTQKWLTSSVSGFFSSIFLTQPIKVVLMAIFFALIIRRDNDDIIDSDDDDVFLDGDEEYLHAFDDGSLLTFRSKSGHIPLTQGEIEYARKKRLNEIKMWDIIRELFAYISFLWILYVVSYSNRNPNSFYLVNHLTENFLNLNNDTYDFTQIYRLDEYWRWLHTTFIPSIRATNWYNGAPPANLSGFISDKTNRILGWGTMRQLRVKPGACKVLSEFTNLVPTCEADYSSSNEDQQLYNPGWSSLYNATVGPFTNYSSSITNAFMYNSSSNLDTYSYVGQQATYGGGGYVYEFRGLMNEMFANVSLLKDLSWLDVQTRAVIIQLSLYNPNVNLFIYVTILAEFLPTSGVLTSASIEPLSLLESYQGFYLFTLLCGIVYMLFIVYYMQREIRSLFHRRMQYFRDFWTYPELGIIVCSWTAFAAYIWRITEGNRVSKLFAETNGYAYVNLQMASYVNNVLTDLLAFCCFFATIKFLRLLRFNHRMSLLSSTLSYAARDLISFTFMFSILYCGYLTLFYLVFQAKVYQCSDVLKTAQMLFEMMLLKFSISFLYNANPILGPICFTLFIIFIVFICMNMFISIIADSFRVVRRNISLQQSEHEIVNFTINQFKKWTGIGRTQEMDRLHISPYDGTHVQYQDPVTSFPDKMDELLIALNKIYMDTKRHDTFAFRRLDNNTQGADEKSTEEKNKKSYDK